jgi:hypothetical protein
MKDSYLETRIKVQDILGNQLPRFIVDESPKTVDFLKQYYISQEYQSGPVDIAENLDQYLNLDTLVSEVIVGITTLSSDISSTETTITVSGGTKGYPDEYGLLKIDNEIITYTGITSTSFTGCIRGFSGITDYHQDLNQEELVFSSSSATSHSSGSSVTNLSSLFLKDFYNKFKFTFAPGLEGKDFTSSLNVGNFLKEIKSFYISKGTNESFRILYNVLYGRDPKVINLEELILKPSVAKFKRRQVALARLVSGNPLKIKGQSIFKDNSSSEASVSDIQAVVTDNEVLYQIDLFIGYDEISDIKGVFKITPNSKSVEESAAGSNVITVDSTIGFSDSGTIVSGNKTITYTDKTINQFLGCTGIESTIEKSDIIRSNELYFGYEDGDTSKRVDLIFVGVLNDFVQDGNLNIDEGDVLKIKNYGIKIENPESDKSKKEIFANSWIYNTSSTYQITSFNNQTVQLSSLIDRSSLKIGDNVEIIDRFAKNRVFPTNNNDQYPIITAIDVQNNSVILSNFVFAPDDAQNYNLRRVLNKVKTESEKTLLKYGNSVITSDVQNVYFDESSRDFYVASNSLPSEFNGSNEYRENLSVEVVRESLPTPLASDTLGGFNDNEKYTQIKFTSNPTKFTTGDKVLYSPEGDPLLGLTGGVYYIKKISSNTIELYASLSAINSGGKLEFLAPISNDLGHIFTLYSHRTNIIDSQKLLKKFPLVSNFDKNPSPTKHGGIGMLINGVEIDSYKSLDKVYYGKLNSIEVLNGGEDFDVINPPELVVSESSGTRALAQPVLKGTLTDILIDEFNYNVNQVISIGVTGGNGTNISVVPIIQKRFVELPFDARSDSNGGKITLSNNRILFDDDHGLEDGQEVVYDSNLNNPLGVGAGSSTLVSDGRYFAKVLNNKTIKLFSTLSDLNGNTNEINFNGTNTSGIHKIKVGPYNLLKQINVLDGGVFYNNKLQVSPSGISTITNTINFNNHGFSSGEIVEYSSSGTTITNLNINNQYYVLKITDNSFRVCDAGIGGTVSTNYEKKNYIEFDNTGTGYQTFKYPDIKSFANVVTVGLGTTSIQSITLTPVVKGSIDRVHLYEAGTKYGSTIKNYERKPTISVKNGRDARVRPIIVGGQVQRVNVEYGGAEYYSIPNLNIIDPTNSGTGCVLRPVIENQRLVDVKVINAGAGYSETQSFIDVISSGKNQVFDANVRFLTVVNGGNFDVDNNLIFDSKVLSENKKETALNYSVLNYEDNIFLDNSSKISGIIGWAYDGNPIYGPYGSKDPNESSVAEILTSGYTKNSNLVEDRPSTSIFPEGFFVEDYTYDNSGDLDEYNGRFEKNSDFPNGVYAYHALLDGNGKGVFPYFIGDKYYSSPEKENFDDIDQTFDFNNSNLKRNTFPYKLFDSSSENNFIRNTIEKEHRIEIVSTSSGSIESFNINDGGTGYKVNQILKFDNSDTNGSGISAKIFAVKGKDIVDVTTTETNIANAVAANEGGKIRVSVSTSHPFNDNDIISFSGISSTSVADLQVSSKINVLPLSNTRCLSTVSSVSDVSTPISSDILVSFIPSYVSADSVVSIGTETCTVLNAYQDSNILTVQRTLTGLEHPKGTILSYTQKDFTVDIDIPTSLFGINDSRVNEKVYFNPSQSVGIGTTVGTTNKVSFTRAGTPITRNIPVQEIYLENHPFTTNEKIVYDGPNSAIEVKISPNASNTDLEDFATLYAVKTSANTIGIKTGIGTTVSNLYFDEADDKIKASFRTDYDQITVDLKKINSVVSVSTSHGMNTGDTVILDHKSNLSKTVTLKRDSENGFILVNSDTIDSFVTASNILTLTSHEFKTGDKVKYSTTGTPPTGLTNNSYYYVYVDGVNTIQLCETYVDAVEVPSNAVTFSSTGSGTHTISLVNSQISLTRNDNLVFDTSDSSLSGYNLRLFYDQEFDNEFVSTGSTSTFSVTGTGSTITTLTYSNSLPDKLYYALEKSGHISTADFDVKNFSEIKFFDSGYDGEFTIIGAGTTTFTINPPSVERLSYTKSQTDTFEYETTSTSAVGPVSRITLMSGGSDYKKSPIFVGVGTTTSTNAIIIPSSKEIGNVKNIRSISNSFEYLFDRTLRPEALIPQKVEFLDSNTIDTITVTNNGSNYINNPDVIIIDSNTNSIINSGFLTSEINSGELVGVNVITDPVGLPEKEITIRTINNDNGVAITGVTTVSSTRFKCTIQTPVSGFIKKPFEVGDEAYIEGITASSGLGFNSEDYGYRFFKVVNVDTASGSNVITFDFTGISTNIGVPGTASNYGRLIPKTEYPQFSTTYKTSLFTIGENILCNGIITDLEVVESKSDYLKIIGNYVVSSGDNIEGSISKNTATVSKITDNKGTFTIDFSNKAEFGWDDDTGKTNTSVQVIPDNDYYQNLSYSVKSPITWKESVNTTNNLVHTVGLKNFADTEVETSSSVSIGGTSASVVIVDVIDELRADTIYNFDNARDVDVADGKSRFIELEKTRLTDFINCKTNNALTIDNINQQFSNLEDSPDEFLNIDNIDGSSRFDTYLVKLNSFPRNKNQAQLSEIVLLSSSDSSDNILINKSELINSGDGAITSVDDLYGSYQIQLHKDGENYFRFVPNDPYDVDYDLKFIKTSFGPSAGIGSTIFGSITLRTFTAQVSSDTSQVTEYNINQYNALYVNTKVEDLVTHEMNYVETYVTHDGTDTKLSESFVGSTLETKPQIGFSTASISGSTLILGYENPAGNNKIRISQKIVGIGTTGSGNGEYRYSIGSEQVAGAERSAVYQSINRVGIGTTTIVELDSSLFDAAKSIVYVQSNNFSALHQLTVLHDDTNGYIQQAPFLTNDNVVPITGLGTFGVEFSPSGNLTVKFHPEDLVGVTTVNIFNQAIYKILDLENTYPSLDYGRVSESVSNASYNAVNGARINKKDFDLKYQNTPIFSKSFNPSSAITAGTGKSVFNIEDHFFRPGEELIYTPNSTIVGVGSTPMMYEDDAGNVGVLTSRVFAIRITKDSFGISTTKAKANAGTGVTITSFGEGNAHIFEMTKSNEKSIISIDGIIQSPINNIQVSHTLENNPGSGIGTTTTIFSLSGISTIKVDTILKVEDEYMRILSVGIGTSTSGPITVGVGTYSLVEVTRGFVGSSATSHANGVSANLFQGSFNIVNSKIHFAEAPRGNPQQTTLETGLPFPRSTFNGRVFLRNSYDTNIIYDDISKDFTGITSEFILKKNNANTVGIGTSGGNGIVLINGIYQTPITENNRDGNYKIIEDTTAGITTIRFTGVTVENTEQLAISDTDVNRNELPRGGVPITLGSTGGLGYAPLVPANVIPVLDGNGAITSIIGVATAKSDLGINTASYDKTTGILSVTTNTNHDFNFGTDFVKLEGLEFSCPGGSGITTTIFPDTATKVFAITKVVSPTIFETKVGTSTITHTYVGQGSAYPYYPDLTFGSGYNSIVSIGVTVYDPSQDAGGSIATITASPVGFNTHYFENGSQTGSIALESDPTNKIAVQTGTTYDPLSGIATFVVGSGHPFSVGDSVIIADNSLTFTCAQDSRQTTHTYPRSTDPMGSGSTTSIGSTTATTVTLNVGASAAHGGGRLQFNIGAGGTGYNDPQIFVSPPSYESLEVRGVSRLGIGDTTDTGSGLLVDIVMQPSSEYAGIGTYEVGEFVVARSGFGFERGDKFEPVGLVTDYRLKQVETEFIMEVIEEFTDSFCMWQFGEIDYIDSIKNLQTGFRKRFPIKYNNELFSIEKDDVLFEDGDLSNIMLVIRNRVVQEPIVHYYFIGGTSIVFTDAPEPQDDIQIFFYRGTKGVDETVGTATTNPPIKPGDQIILSSPLGLTTSQTVRTSFRISNSDSLETNVYSGDGIDEENYKPITVIKQKNNFVADGELVTKDRKSLTSRIFPVAKIIGDIETSTEKFFVDTVNLFDYENNISQDIISARLVAGTSNPVAAAITATVSTAGTISALTINNGGSGYNSSSPPTIKISNPYDTFSVDDEERSIISSIGVTATATATVSSAGTVSSVNITNAGSGYTTDTPPGVIVELPSIISEEIGSIGIVTSMSGAITGIGTTLSSSQLAIKFTTENARSFDGVIAVGDPIFIYDTEVGFGVTSVNATDSNVVGIGTTFVDNVYIISELSESGNPIVGVITCTVNSNTNTTGISAVGYSTNPVGRYSVGIISSITRSSSPISIGVTGLTVDVGLTTFPSIIRTGGQITFNTSGAIN